MSRVGDLLQLGAVRRPALGRPARQIRVLGRGSIQQQLTDDVGVAGVMCGGGPLVYPSYGRGVGWRMFIDGGFGMVVDGSEDADRHIREMLLWDVNNGIARRSWARNEGAMSAIRREMERTPGLQVTLPNVADEELIRNILKENE